MNLLYHCNFIILFGNGCWIGSLSTVLLYRQNIIILFWKYVVDIRCEAWLNLFWEYTNGKLFAVCLLIPRKFPTQIRIALFYFFSSISKELFSNYKYTGLMWKRKRHNVKIKFTATNAINSYRWPRGLSLLVSLQKSVPLRDSNSSRPYQE